MGNAPDREDRPPASHWKMCERWSARRECGGCVMCVRMESWLPIVPEVTRSAAGKPVRAEMWDSRAVVVGSSAKTSSRRVQFWMEVSMEGVGVVTTSPGIDYDD